MLWTLHLTVINWGKMISWFHLAGLAETDAIAADAIESGGLGE